LSLEVLALQFIHYIHSIQFIFPRTGIMDEDTPLAVKVKGLRSLNFRCYPG